jgi:hypothetical protein
MRILNTSTQEGTDMLLTMKTSAMDPTGRFFSTLATQNYLLIMEFIRGKTLGYQVNM